MKLIATFRYQGSGAYRSERQVEVSAIKATFPGTNSKRYLFGYDVTAGRARQFKQFDLGLMDDLQIHVEKFGLSVVEQLRDIADQIERETR